MGRPINVSGEEHYVHLIELWCLTLKESIRCYYAMLPFKHLTRAMTFHLSITVAFYVNEFLWKCGVSQVLPLLTVIEGTILYFYFHFRVTHSEFLQKYEGTDKIMTSHMTYDIPLGPNGNLQGRIICFSLDTGRILQRSHNNVTIF